MINNLLEILTVQNVYLFANWGVIPFWILLIFLPNHALTNIFVHSIIIPLILALAYSFFAYNIFLEGNILDSFELYQGLDGLYSMFANEIFLLIFWLHFLALSLFLGSWISRDSLKYNIPKFLTAIFLILTYFTGPVGLLAFWLVRIIFAKKINFNY